MSKAFTRESDSGAEEIPTFRPQLPPGTRNFITRVGADGLRQRLTDLLERKQALGTRSIEASATVEADLRKLESAIRRLQQTLASVVVAEIPADQEKIAFGAPPAHPFPLPAPSSREYHQARTERHWPNNTVRTPTI